MNNNKTYWVSFVVMLLAVADTWAAPRPLTAMRNLAQQVLSKKCANASLSPDRREIKLMAQETNYSVWGYAEGGYAIVSADDNLPPVLGYSQSAFTTEDMCPGVRWFLDALARIDTKKGAARTTKPDTDRFPAECPPLLTTRWGQDAPFNYMCPQPDYSPWGGYLPDVAHCPVGCVATAAAQIMNFHKYPLRGEGSHTLLLEVGPTAKYEYTVDFSEATYDWDNMIDDYSEGYTDEQARAVAQLCYHVGVASEMGYSADFSSSDNYYAVMGMGQYFGYDISRAKFIDRDTVPEPAWMDSIYTELSERRPIFFEAVGIDYQTYEIYGHSFVLDGYDADGMVHVNWGWDGRYDGFYDVALLNPRDLNFQALQVMIVGIRPKDAEQSSVSQPLVAAPASTSVYGIDGILWGKPQKGRPGLYIRNGKKWLVR